MNKKFAFLSFLLLSVNAFAYAQQASSLISIPLGSYAGVNNYACKGYAQGLFFAFVYGGDWSLGKSEQPSTSAIVRDSKKSSFMVSIKDVSRLISEVKRDFDLVAEFAKDVEVAKFLLEGNNPNAKIGFRKIELNVALDGIPTKKAAYAQYTSTITKPGVSIAVDGWAYMFFVGEKLITLNLLALQSDDRAVWAGYYGFHKVMSNSFTIANSSTQIDVILDRTKALVDRIKK